MNSVREKRIVVAVLTEAADDVLSSWQRKLDKYMTPLGIKNCHVQIVGKCSVMRWDWTMISDREIYDLIDVLERSYTPYEIVTIGNEGLTDISHWASHKSNRLPILLSPRITVDVIEF